MKLDEEDLVEAEDTETKGPPLRSVGCRSGLAGCRRWCCLRSVLTSHLAEYRGDAVEAVRLRQEYASLR